MLGAPISAAALAFGVAVAAHAEATGPAREGPPPGADPVLDLEAPAGHCRIDGSQARSPGHATGFEPGLKSGMELLALYVPSGALEAARAGALEWLPEWIAIEKNTVTYPSDDGRSLGTFGAVRQLCRDARSAEFGHARNETSDFAAVVAQAHGRLSTKTPVVFLGVIGEEDHACFISSLRLEFSPSGNPQRFLVVTAFMQTADRWVIQSVRREMPVPPEAAPQGAEDVLRTAKTAAKVFFDRNR
jgi:hypothetical protein